MIFEPDERLKRKMSKNGSVLQYMYSVAGAGKGLITMGIMLIFIAVLLAAALFNTMGNKAVMLAAVIAVPSILLIVLGLLCRRKGRRAGCPVT